MAVIAPADDGLRITVLPAIIAAAVGPTDSAIGKLNGLMTANTPCGRRIVRVWTVEIPEVVHRVVVERVVLGRLRVVADEVGPLLDLAQGLEPRLADLDGHQARVLHLALGDQLRRALQDLQPLLPSEPEPRRLRTIGRP